MLTEVTLATASLARLAALRPIHFAIITCLLGSVAYLAVVDEYIPGSFQHQQVMFYHPPGSTEYGDWVRVEDAAPYESADQYVILPLKFHSYHSASVPEIKGAIVTADTERLLVVPLGELPGVLEQLREIKHEGVTWKARRDSFLRRYCGHARVAFAKLHSLVQGAEAFDIVLIALAYVAMVYTIVKLFVDMKQDDTNFLFAFATLVSSMFACFFALAASTKVLGFRALLLSLTEGIPFLTAIVGFKHKVSIAKMVLKTKSGLSDVKSMVSNAVASHSLSIFRDYGVVFGVLLVTGLFSADMEGLRTFCLFACLLLAFDLLLIYSFFSAVLALKVEIHRARKTQELLSMLEEEGVSSLVAATIAAKTAEAAHHDDHKKTTTALLFKVAALTSFFLIHGIYLGSSWFHSNGDHSFVVASRNLSRTASKYVSIGAYGTVVTLLSPSIYAPFGAVIMVEDAIASGVSIVSSAIQDSFISKFLLFAFAISISSNVYLLNATRSQRTTTHKLIENEMSKPKERHTGHVGTPAAVEPAQNNGHVQVQRSETSTVRALDECYAAMQNGHITALNNDEVASLVVSGNLPLYALEKHLADNTRAVIVRRKAIAKLANAPFLDTDSLPYADYDYDRVFGACCENVIGYMPLPVGVAGPLIIDGVPYHIPMATTEGCLVASTMRGCKAINFGGGVNTIITQDGMTRGPCVSFTSLARAGACKLWLDSEEGQKTIKKAFNSTSRFARLQQIKTAIAGTLLFIRFKTTTGDAMGMNMISKGVEHSLKYMMEHCGWDDMVTVAVSGNYCTDKKPAAINWIEGRGKSVVAEATVLNDVVRKVLKSDVGALVEVNTSKNLIGSAMAGSVGGFNAQAANLVTAVYLACGQDPAQNVESSNCMTLMNKTAEGDLQISVSMPSIEVGTIGGGTILEPQGTMLELLGVRGPHPDSPGSNARRFACIVASAVLAAELSLCSALAAGHLVQSHMQLNRKGGAPAANEDVARLEEGSVTCIKS
ncbi:hypothetical protein METBISCDRAFT_13777 [Metschnikowia bicuspidata]|uniref:3-hydroxy-3-methylglutaryl coenzyme A reductase n=1 Tax=Metschnikowia bicuspidata TaxID=27322 RepID=A0A4P9ZEX7_9ASCO|nr:hypothetical protein METBISCDRAFT_13777 [Metschnikowia bicuspidata]